MTPTEQQARLDGQMAALKDKTPLDNPHTLGTTASRAWNRGFREVMGMRAE